MKTQTRTTTLAALVIALVAATHAFAGVPDVVTYAGSLRQGAQPANGTFSAVFELFDAATDGNRLFTQAEPSLAVTGGELVVDLGSDPINPLNDDLLASGALFLQITVNGEELGPRVPFTSVPFARRAKIAEEANSVGGLSAEDISNLYTAGAGLTKSGTTFALAPGGVVAADLAPGAVTAPAIANGAVTAAALAAGSVDGTKLANGSVGTAQLANQSVGTAQLAFSAVGSFQILDGAVTNLDLADNAVINAKLADGAVTNAKLAAASVNSANIIDQSITANDIAPRAVGNAQLGDFSISVDKLQTASVAGIKMVDHTVTTRQVKGVPVVREPTGCGGALRIGGVAADAQCKTEVCGIDAIGHAQFETCNGTCSLSAPTTCAVPQTEIGQLVVQ